MNEAEAAHIARPVAPRGLIHALRRALRPVPASLVLIALVSPLARAQRVDTSSALGALRDAATACGNDAGALWGRSLCGSIALVDRGTRLAIMNDSVAGRTLLPYGAAFVTSLPAATGLANTSFEWGGHEWAMILLP